MNKKKFFMIFGGSALLLVAILFGAFYAGPLMASANSKQNANSATASATSTTNPYCTQYQQDLAQRLGVSVSTLQQDSQAARIDIVNQRVKDGKLTQSQANTLIQRIQAHQPCTGRAHSGKGHFVRNQFLQQYRADILSQIAQGLNLSSSQLTTDLQQGQSLSQIASAQHVSASQLTTIVTNAITNDLNKAVSAGNLTQSQATAAQTFLQKHPHFVTRLINRHLKQK